MIKMTRTRFLALAGAAAVLLMAAGVLSPMSASAQGSAFSIDKTPIGVLLDDPRAKAVLDSNVPGFSKTPQFDLARTMTLRAVQPFAPDKLTEAVLAKIDAELKAIK